MRQIKLLAIILMLALAGFVYAAGNAQESKKSCGMDKADCCAGACCKAEGSGCLAHKMGNQSRAGAQAALQDKAMACQDCECCKDGKSCCGKDCKMDKAGKAAACCDMSKEGGCCSGGCACCSKDKAKTD